MSTAEYIATFASIIVGLAIADLAISFHRLLRARARIEWDWLPLAAALVVLLTIVQFWWVSFARWTGQSEFGFGEFLPHLLALLLLFLLAATALPDEIPKGRFDLRRFYEENRSYFWGLFVLLVLAATLVRISRLPIMEVPLSETVRNLLGNLVLAALMAVLAFTRRRLVHALLVSMILIFLCWVWFRLSVGT